MQNFKFILLDQGVGKTALMTVMPVGLLVQIAYASVRNIDNEEGAVQRILNTGRINSIKDFTLANGNYPGAIVLNWLTEKNSLFIDGEMVGVEAVERSAQIIDGQHRLAGIKAAIIENSDIATTLNLPVVIYQNLSTKECADIFLSINTEQKSVPRSLVYDLYGLASEEMTDPAASRARDIAYALHEEKESPFFGEIKMPGDRRRKGGVALSTAVSSIKPLVEENGPLHRAGFFEFATQKKAIFNYFEAVKGHYSSVWDDYKYNPFLFGAGFSGASEFFKDVMIPYCIEKKSFKMDVIADVLNFNPPIYQEEIKGLGGKDAEKLIVRRMTESFSPAIHSSNIEL